MLWLYALVTFVILHYAAVFLFPTLFTFQVVLFIRVMRGILFLIVLFSIHNRLQVIINDDIGPIGTQLSGVMTFFFSVIYLQYKINEAIDSSKNALP